MMQIKASYFNDVGRIKNELLDVINEYLKKYYRDLWDEEQQTWKSIYKTSRYRFFSHRGKTGYFRALALRQMINASPTIFQLIPCVCDSRKVGSGLLGLLIIRHLFQNGIVDPGEYNRAYLDYTSEQEAVLFSSRETLERRIKLLHFKRAWREYNRTQNRRRQSRSRRQISGDAASVAAGWQSPGHSTSSA